LTKNNFSKVFIKNGALHVSAGYLSAICTYNNYEKVNKTKNVKFYISYIKCWITIDRKNRKLYIVIPEELMIIFVFAIK